MTDSKKIKIILGLTVKELRKQKNLTQEQLAEHVGLQPQTIAKIENAVTFVSSNVLANLCNFFDVDPAIFFAKKTRILSDEDNDVIAEIRRLLPTFEPAKLREIHKILLAMRNS